MTFCDLVTSPLTYPGVAAGDEDSAAPGLVLAAAQQTPHQPRQHACTDTDSVPWIEVLEVEVKIEQTKTNRSATAL